MPSVTVSTRSAATFSSTCFVPLGHAISMRSIVVVVAEAEVRARIARRDVAGGGRHRARLIADGDAGADGVAVAAGADQFEGDPVARLRGGVLPQLGGRAQRRHRDVDAAVVIEIRRGGAVMRRSGGAEVRARVRRPVAKLAAAGVEEEAVRLFVDRRLERLDAIVDVRVRGEQILQAVVVQIDEQRGPAAQLRADHREAARLRRFDERAAALIAIERKRLAGQRRQMDVGTAVVVVVLKIRPHARHRAPVRRHRHARQQPRLLERAIAAIAEQEVRARCRSSRTHR